MTAMGPSMGLVEQEETSQSLANYLSRTTQATAGK